MAKRESISRLTLIANKIRSKQSTFKEIEEYLARESEVHEYNYQISKRTFQRDLNDIRTILNIDIRFSFSRKVYYIDHDGQKEVNDKVLEAFNTFNALNVSESVSQYIHFEKYKPHGTQHLIGLLHAIKHHFVITFSYNKYWEENALQRTVEPYALKEFKNRWYVVVRDINDKQIKTYALDRLSKLHITKRKFIYPNNFNVDDFFKNAFGIITPEHEEPQEIILSFAPLQGKYIKSLPLHHSQQVMVDNDKELRVKINVCVTYDLEMEILSYGSAVKVLTPKFLITKIKGQLKNALKQY